MDLLNIVWTVVSFAVFVAIIAWTYSARARSGFEAAARLPLEDDVDDAADRHVGQERAR